VHTDNVPREVRLDHQLLGAVKHDETNAGWFRENGLLIIRILDNSEAHSLQISGN